MWWHDDNTTATTAASNSTSNSETAINHFWVEECKTMTLWIKVSKAEMTKHMADTTLWQIKAPSTAITTAIKISNNKHKKENATLHHHHHHHHCRENHFIKSTLLYLSPTPLHVCIVHGLTARMVALTIMVISLCSRRMMIERKQQMVSSLNTSHCKNVTGTQLLVTGSVWLIFTRNHTR